MTFTLFMSYDSRFVLQPQPYWNHLKIYDKNQQILSGTSRLDHFYNDCMQVK
jgi:hypothetical protein